MKNSNFDNYSETFFDALHKGDDFDKIAQGLSLYYYNCLPNNIQAPILDVGCGVGQFLKFLESKGYQNTEGIELCSQQAEIAKKHLNCPIHIGEVADFLKEKKGKYQLIALNDVLEHIPKDNMVSFINTLKNGLKDDGTLVVNVPQVAGITTSYNRYNDFTHNIVFTEMSLRQVLRLAGFSKIQFVTEKWPIKLTLRHLIYRLIRWVWYKFLTLAYIIEMPGETRPTTWQIRLVAVAKK